MLKTISISILLSLAASAAPAFEIGFTWDGLKLCQSGRPNTVSNPEFKIDGVPEGTKFIRFRLVDKDVPGFDHGGGVVEYNGDKVIPSGKFKYKSPCPPGGSHLYEWVATAQSKKNGGKIAVATAQRRYPE